MSEVRKITACDEILHSKRIRSEGSHAARCWEVYFTEGKFYSPATGKFFKAPEKLLAKPRSF